MIDQKMFRGKKEQFRFYAITPNGKKDTTNLTEFKKTILSKR